MDIEVHYNRDADVNHDEKARIERAGKAWSRYVRTRFEGYTVDADATAPWEGVETEVEVDDFLVVVGTKSGGDAWSHGGSTGYRRVDGKYVVPGMGQITLSEQGLARNSTIVHEIGHAIQLTEPTIEGLYNPTLKRHANADGTHFEGPEAMKVHGGPGTVPAGGRGGIACATRNTGSADRQHACRGLHFGDELLPARGRRDAQATRHRVAARHGGTRPTTQPRRLRPKSTASPSPGSTACARPA